MNKAVITIFILFLNLISYGQFSVNKPSNWYDNSSSNEIYENINRIIQNEKKSNDLINDIELKKGVIIKAFSKYDVNKSKGLSPSIIVALVKNEYHHNLTTLKKDSETNFIKELKKYTINVNLKYSKYITIDDKKGFLIHNTYNLPNYKENIRSWVYFFFLSDNYFVQISFSDLDSDICENLFSEFLKTIKFN
jgi:hypothetical protein